MPSVAESEVPVCVTWRLTLLSPPEHNACSIWKRISSTVSFGVRASPHLIMQLKMSRLKLITNYTSNIDAKPLSVRFDSLVPPTLHVRQKWLQVKDAWLHSSACIGLSPAKSKG